MKLNNFINSSVALALTVSTHVRAFASVEHKGIGDGVTLKFLSDPKDPTSPPETHIAGNYPLASLPGVGDVTYGDVLAIPDYVGLPTDPLSDTKQDDQDMEDQAQLYWNTFYQIEHDGNQYGFGSEKYQNFIINKLFEAQKEHVWAALAAGEDPGKDWPNDYIHLFLSGLGRNEELSSWLTLQTHNLDHFGDDGDAEKAWRAMRKLAVRTAIEAGWNYDENGLKEAYMINAFGDHFLSDQWATGHSRVPRHALMDHFGATCGGEWALNEHDYENKVGLVMSNKSEKWQAYGDYYFFTAGNLPDAAKVNTTIAMSAEGIFDAYVAAMKGQNVTVDDDTWFTPLDYVPSSDNFENFSPLFKVDDKGTLQIRKDLDDLYATEYVNIGDSEFILCEAKYAVDDLILRKRDFKGHRCDDDHPCSNGNPCGSDGTCGVNKNSWQQRREAATHMGF
eukprot:Clim_evm14s43 gene=Clim_evmTU14s43